MLQADEYINLYKSIYPFLLFLISIWHTFHCPTGSCIIYFKSMKPTCTRVIQKIRRQRCFWVHKVFINSNLTHGKIQNHMFYQQVMFQLIWFSSLHLFDLFDYKNCMFLCHGAPQRHNHSVMLVQFFFLKMLPSIFHSQVCVLFIP